MSKHLAPNGNPSNLNPEQYRLVRTHEFKAWFGDWENLILTKINDSGIDEISLKRLEDGVSKVVDENGEPMVMYHGTDSEFTIFDISSPIKHGRGEGEGFYFTRDKNIAKSYGKNIKTVFLNAKKSWRGFDSLNSEEKKIYLSTKSDKQAYEKLKIDNIFISENHLIVFNPNQIKLADGTNTTFDGNNPDIRFKDGGRTIAQTPAPKKDQIKGSDVNPKGSSTDKKSAKDIKFSPEVSIAIRNKIDKHNNKYPKNKVDFNTAKAVVRRGMGAYSFSHRPTIKGGKPNSRVAWGLARLDAFLYKIVNGKSKSGKYSQDNDLIEELGYKVQKYADGGLVGDIFTEIIYRAVLSTETTTDIYAQGNNIDEIKSEYDSISADDFDNPNSIGNSKILDRIINKYEFIGDDKLNAEDYIDDLQNTDFWNLIEEDFDEIEFDSVDAINKSTDEMIDEIREFIKQEYNIGGRYASKYMTISVDDENEDFIADLNIRTADHSQNYRNNDATSYNLSFVIANKNATQGRFIPLGEEYYYDDNSDIEDIKEEIKGVIDEKIEYIKEKGRKYADGGQVDTILKNEIIDVLSKNKRYSKEILDVQIDGLQVLKNCIESNTRFGNVIKQANENYIMIPISYEDNLFAIDKKVEYVYFAKPNENTKIRVEYKYDFQDYPMPVLFDSELINNKEFYSVNDYEEINSSEFDAQYLYRGINSNEMQFIIENGFIKSNALMNIGEQQAETTSFAQHISQASSYAVGFNAWYDEITFIKPKYIIKVAKEGLDYKPTLETEIRNEVDVFGKIPIQKIEFVYEFRLAESTMGSVEIISGLNDDYSEGSRSQMFKKVFVRKTNMNTFIEEINSKNKIEKNNDMKNLNPKDTITMNIPLLMRYSELMREDIKTDVDLHKIVENILKIKDRGTLTMDDYESIVGNVTSSEKNPEEEKLEEGGKVESIKAKKGDIKLMLDENWYSDDTDVELVPVSELIKFREFDRKVSPKYNKENSVDNINHLKFMFQKDGVKSPLIIEYSKEDNAVLIIEGNHRLNSAIDLGMEYLPARVVLKKYSKFSKNQLKNAMKVSGVEANEFGYIPSNMKPSKVGIQGTKPIVFGDGGIIEGRLHSECDVNEGCGRKFQVGENGHIIEAERDEAVIVADAFDDNQNYTVEGTPSEIASALNVMGGGKNFDKGAEILKNGQELVIPELEKEAIDKDVDDVIDSGSIIINRRSMADEKEYKVTGTPKQIASAINSLDGNGVVIEKGAEIKEN
jgi:hypothetical protein